MGSVDTHLPTPGVSGYQAGGYVGSGVSTRSTGASAHTCCRRSIYPGTGRVSLQYLAQAFSGESSASKLQLLISLS